MYYVGSIIDITFMQCEITIDEMVRVNYQISIHSTKTLLVLLKAHELETSWICSALQLYLCESKKLLT
jgi:hypothetical protein